ncbi:limonene cyclase [Bacillus pseudomycoides]|nr:limonene cyclase [Bacillus pseudomycoides]PFZ84113.1 limonene cyclase [Bacillus pseudomycoides]PGE15775.1 limonene cyclase [Bacillus pseudomycoides]
MNIHDKFELEKRIFNRLIEHNKQNNDPHSHLMILAYEHGLQVLEEMYEASQQKEKVEIAPF